MATSAICVTGLATIDNSVVFTPFGNGVLLFLIQVGGIGIMTLWLFVLSTMGPLAGQMHVLASAAIGEKSVRKIGQILFSVVTATLIIEGLGVILLFSSAIFLYDFPKALGWSVFHAISAFCNAGFSLQSDSLMKFADHSPVNITIMILITLGGIGYAVIHELYFRTSKILSLHTTLVVVASVGLLFSGAIMMAILEWNGAAYGGASAIGKIERSFFLSVTPRTAGFNTVDTGLLQPATIAVVMGLMLIGGSPGSTAGGFKTTVLAIILLRARSILTGTSYVRTGRWEISDSLIFKAVWILVVYLAVAATLSFALLLTESALPAELNRHGSFGVIFELVSALGTVGLSTGITPHLSAAGKLILVAAMFLGRIGPLTFAFAIGGKPKSSPVKFVEGDAGLG